LIDENNGPRLLKEEFDLISKDLIKINQNNLQMNLRLVLYNFSKLDQITSLQDLG